MLAKAPNLDQRVIGLLSATKAFQEADRKTVKEYVGILEEVRDHLSAVIDRAEGKR
jgi:hypothetical protein